MHSPPVDDPLRHPAADPPWTATVPAWIIGVILVMVVVVIPTTVLLVAPPDGEPVETGPAIISAAVAIVLLLVRRRWPIAIVVVAVGLTALITAATQQRTLLLLAAIVLLYSMATVTERRTAWLVGLGSVIVLFTSSALFLNDAVTGAQSLATVAWVALAVAAGDAVRSRRAYVAAVEDRARRAEAARDVELRRRVAEERLRIARELHDVVAHRMTVISVQAAAAGSLLRRDPDAAATAIETVRSSASTVLDELGGLLRVLRTSDDDAASVEPAPSLADLDELVDSFAAAGLEVRHEVSGLPRSVPESVQLAAYRVAQEALTNAQKHGDGTATMRVAYTPTVLEVTVENPTARAAGPNAAGSGLGLLGMRERVAAAGGSLEAASPTPGRFEVVARLPIATDAVR